MNIYICITPFFPTDTCFSGPFIYDQVRAIIRSGHFDRVIVLRPCGMKGGYTSYIYQEIEVFLFPSYQLPSMFLPGALDFLNIWAFKKRLQYLGLLNSSSCLNNQPDSGFEKKHRMEKKISYTVHVHAASLAKYGVWVKEVLKDATLWIQHHNLDPFGVCLGRFNRWTWHRRLMLRDNIRYVSHYDWQIGVSQHCLDQLRAFPGSCVNSFHLFNKRLKNLQNISPPRINRKIVLYNGVDIRKFQKGKIDQRSFRDLQHSTFQIGCVANFQELKGHLTLFKAMDQLVHQEGESGFQLTLVGRGETLEAYKAFVTKHHLQKHVYFEDAVDHTKLADFYRTIDLFVLPSVFEGFGCVYLEAYACGVPFICCKDQGISEYIFDEDADKWMIEPGDWLGLSVKIKAYRDHRYTQRLKYPIDIDQLVGSFLKVIGSE